ncbi:MAG: plasmid encoded RepA protein, partial [Acidobacteria bacterium]|nr:plasmid encoded RepA protein [Acidobacteriota bacterium]
MNGVSRGPESIGSLLQRAHPELLVSKYKRKQAEGIHLVRQRREQGNQLLGFNSRPFVLCGLPLRRPPKDQLLYERRNGSFVLQVTGHPEFGLPFGQDRLVPIFLATMSVRQQSRVIRFKSASVMLDMFGMANGGKEYRRLVAAFERIFGATMFFGTDPAATARVVHRARFNFLSEATIWYQRESGGENVVTLSQEFFSEVMAHPIPADLEAVKVLVASPGALDLFLWLSYRCFTAKCRES